MVTRSVRRGSLWWVDLGEPIGSEPGFLRPVLVVSDDAYNMSRIPTVVVAAMSSNLRLGDAPGNVVVAEGTAGLSKTSVINVTGLVTIDRVLLQDWIGDLPITAMIEVDAGLRQSLGL